MEDNSESMETQDAEKQRIRQIRVLAYIAVAVVIGWFIVEVFLPSPFPNMAY